MALKPKAVTFTQTTAAALKDAGDPQPLVLVGGTTAGSTSLVTKQAAIADVSTANATDLATAQALANANKVKINAILAVLRSAGIILT